MPQRLRFAPSAHDWAMQACPLVHSDVAAQICAPMAPPGQEPPAATLWHDVFADEPFSIPQQTSPALQSHAWLQPKVTANGPEQPWAFATQLHVPTTVPPEMPVGLKQQSFERRSQPPAFPHTGGT